MRHALPSFTVALGLPLLLSCAVEERGNAASVTDALSLWGRFAQIACQKARDCCEEGGFSTTELEDCDQTILQQSGVDQLIRFVGDESISMDRVLFTRCLDEAEKMSDQCVTPNPIEACVQSIRGRLPEGAACKSAIQCAGSDGSALCLRIVAAGDDDDDTPGVCHNQVRGKRGDACVDTCEESNCLTRLTTHAQPKGTAFCFWEDGLYCDRSEGRCVPVIAPGGACELNESCGEDAFCSDDGLCRRSAGAGEQCELGDECTGNLLCAEASGTCEEASPFDEDFCARDFD